MNILTVKNSRCLQVVVLTLSLYSGASAAVVRVDHNAQVASPGAGWNVFDAVPSGTVTLVDSDGNDSGATVTYSSQWGDSSNTSNHAGAFASTSWSPAASDYFFLNDSTGNSGTITISGLIEGETYTVELVASANNDSSARIADYTVNGSFGDGASPANGDGFDAHVNGYDNGTVMTWTEVVPVNSDIVIAMGRAAGGGSAHLNAFKITATSDTPDPDPAGPNVLMIIIDDLNTWIEPLGEYPDVITPGMNRLAQAGTTFSQAFCQAPACGPSRASFISGLRPSTTGLYGQGSRLGGHPTYAPGQHKTLFESFKDGGYTTAITGKIFHHNSHADDLPSGTFDYDDHNFSFGPYPSSKISDPALSGNSQAVDWGVYPSSDSQLPDYTTTTWALSRMAAFKDQTTPFLMAVGLVRPHVPQFAPQAWWDMYPEGSFELPYTELSDLDDTPRFARYLHWNINGPRTAALLEYNELENFTRSYLACISFVDSQVGRLLDGLEANGLDDDTIVVLMSDHGYHVGEKGMTAKLSLWDRATRMPVLIAGPGVGVGQKSAQPIELLDIYPTLLDLCDLPEYAPLEGQTLRSILEDAENAPDRLPAITTMSINNHAVSDGRYRYIRYADGSEELYDRSIDPNEATNRIDHPNFRETAARLASYLPTVNASNEGGARRFVNIGANSVVTWENVAIQDPLFDPAGPVTRETLEAPVADEPIVDSDSDGIPDYWEIGVAGSLAVLNAGGHDQDGDGTSDVDEFRLGFDATDASSKPSLAIEIEDQNTLRISHSTAPGRDYKILSSVNLTHWVAAGEPVLGTGFKEVSYFNYDSTTTPRQFYTISDAAE